MRQIQQLVYILLHLQFVVRNVFTFNIDMWRENLWKENAIDTMWINEWECSSNDNCTAKSSVCNDGLCQCAPGYIFNADMTACIKVATRLYDSCEETIQCSAYLFTGAKCVENVCVCGPGYYYLHGKCNRYVGLFKKCKQNIDCYVNADFEASTCDAVERICKCNTGFYQREYRTCRREGKAIGDECTIDIDCTFGNVTCNEFVCAVKSDKTVEFSFDDVLSKGILDEEIRVGSGCKTDEDCSVLGNAICDPTGTCRCDRAHFASDTDTKCIPELGEHCQYTDLNYIQNSICREGRWSCTKGTVASKNNRECLNATREYMGNCHLDEQCYIFGPDAVCTNNTCICNENTSHYIASELFCWGNTGIGKTCKQDRDCYVKDFKGNLTCNDTCGCPDGSRLNKDKMSCIGPTELGEACEIDKDCAQRIRYSVCKEKVCSCAENYYESHKHCLAGINATCIANIGCLPENSICIWKRCSCKMNYVDVATNSCMPVSSFGESCSLDIQCYNVTRGAICAPIKQSQNDTTNIMESNVNTENKVCTCSKEDYYRFGKCFKKKFIGETCTNLGECYENSNEKRIVCRNGKCACIWGYKKLNGTVCVKHPQYLKFFLDSGAANVVFTGLFSIISFVFSSKLF